MFNGVSVSKLLLHGIPIILLVGVGVYLYSEIKDSGRAEVQAEWNKAKKERQEEIESLKAKLAEQEQDHRAYSQRISDDLAQANLDHANAVADLQLDFARRLHNVENRTGIYERMSEAGAVERANLASHAAQLDRSLEEGRQLVGELRSTVVQRDRQIELLGEQLLADRQLMDSQPNAQ